MIALINDQPTGRGLIPLDRAPAVREVNGIDTVVDRRLSHDEILDAMAFNSSRLVLRSPVDDLQLTSDMLISMSSRSDSGYAGAVPLAISMPLEVRAAIYNDGPRQVFISAVRRLRRSWLYIRVNRDGSLFWTSTRSSATAESWRKGILLWRYDRG